MRVEDLMTADVITVGPKASLKEAARRMISAGVSGLIVTTDDGTLEGVITEADYVKNESGRRAAKRAGLLRWFSHEEEFPSRERVVEDVMTADVVSIAPDADHAEAARIMRKAGVKRLPVVDADDRLVGIISRSDIMRAFARPDADIIEEITDEVMHRVLWIDPRKVRLTSEDGNVAMSGQLETRSDVTLLQDMARRVDGVVSVKSDLTWEVDNTKVEMVSPPAEGVPPRNWSRNV